MAGTTRKSISVKGPTYERLKRKAEAQGKSSSGLLEELINEKMEELGVAPETVLASPRVSAPEAPPRVTDSGRFTF